MLARPVSSKQAVVTLVVVDRYKNESAAQRVLYRSTFGTQLPGGWFRNALDVRCRNAANTGVLTWGGRCLAMFEAGQPYRLDPTTLQTLGLDNLGGHLHQGVPFTAGHNALNALAGKQGFVEVC